MSLAVRQYTAVQYVAAAPWPCTNLFHL